jgi:diacylglycerol O-acyltransferase / wax synthase
LAVDWLTPEDERILALEGPVVAGHTCKLIELSDAAGLSVEELRAHIGARLDAAPQLTRRLELNVPPRERPAWVEDPAFDIGKHVLELPLGGPVDHAGLRDVVAGLIHARLDRARPLWTIHLVPELDDGGAALVLRIHHALADGSTAMRVCSAILWAPAAGDGAVPRREEPHHGARGASPAPQSDASSPRGAGSVLGRELRPASGRSPLEAQISARRAVAFAAAPLTDVVRIERSVGGATVNDVLLCAVSGGLRRGLPGGATLPRLRAKVPVSMHRPEEGDGVGNRDSFFCVDLDVGEEDPIKRLQAIHEGTTERKAGGDAGVLDALLNRGPRRLSRLAARWSMSPRVFALNVSNVRGPAEPLAVIGRPVRAVYALAEVAQRHALRVACLSASGQVTFGLCADAEALPQLDAIAAGIEDEVADLLARSS